MRLVLVAMLLLLPLSAVPSPASAKDKSSADDYALIFGTVWSPDSRPVYGVHVRLRRASEKKFRWEAFSDHRGEFGIRVPAGQGDYILVTDWKPAKGSTAAPIPDRPIHIDANERIDVGIHLTE